MATSEDRVVESLIRGAEALIRNLDVPAGADPSVLPPAAVEQIDAEATVPMESFTEPSVDGTAIVEISRDAMEARGWFHPPTGNGAPLSLEAVRATIGAKGITFGVDWNAIKGCILTCNEERAEVSDIVLARGKAPVPECPPFLVLSDRLVRQERNDGPEAARVDFKELALFTLVKKGEDLASLQPKRNGAMGMNVRGTAVAFGREHLVFPRPGKNTELWERRSWRNAMAGFSSVPNSSGSRRCWKSWGTST